MPVTAPSARTSETRLSTASTLAATWSPRPTTVSGTSQSHGLR